MANHRWHVLARECDWAVEPELSHPMEKGQAENDLAFWAK
jgi:hypothetical protein